MLDKIISYLRKLFDYDNIYGDMVLIMLFVSVMLFLIALLIR